MSPSTVMWDAIPTRETDSLSHAISTRETILPLLSLLVSIVSTPLDGLRVQFQCTHGFVPGYLLGQTWRNMMDEEGVDDVYAS